MNKIFCLIFLLLLFSSNALACQPLPRGSLFDEELVEKASEAFIGTVTEKISTPEKIKSVFKVDRAIKNVKEAEGYIPSESIACGTVATGDIWLIFHLPEITCTAELSNDHHSPKKNDISEMDKNSLCMMRNQQRYIAYQLWSEHDFDPEQVKDLLIQVKNKFGYELPAYALENR